jgi:tetratricopeptide (TPR) repeat protein
VRRIEGGRFDLHEVIRQYALPYFAGDPQNLEISDRYSEYYLGLVGDREQALKSAAQQEAVRELTVEMDNVRAAWTWAIQREKFAWIRQALRSFGWLCDVAGWLREGIEQMEPVVQVLRPRVIAAEAGLEDALYPQDALYRQTLGLTLAQQGILYFRKGRFDRAMAAFDESLVILRPLGDPVWMTDALVWGGVLSHHMGDTAKARALTEEGIACAQALGDSWFEGYALYNLGYLSSQAGRYADGYEQMLAALSMWRALGDPSITALGLNYISPTAIQLGHLEEAQAFLQESLSLCLQVGDRWSLGTVYRNLGLTALAQGSPMEAQSHLQKSLEIFGDYTVGWDIARTLTYLGEAALAAGDLNEARNYYLDALRLAAGAHSIPLALDAILGLAHWQLQGGEAEGAFALAFFVLNHAAGTQEMRNRASHLVMEAGEKLDEDRIQSAKERSQGWSFESIIEWISF